MPEAVIDDIVLAVFDHTSLYLMEGEDAAIQIEDLYKGRQLHRL
jgi:hypothetical protein